MAKKRAKAQSEPSSERVTVLNLKGSPEFRDWLNKLSGRTLIPASSIARAALADWASKHGHERPPKR